MRSLKVLSIMLLAGLLSGNAFAQFDAAFHSLLYPHTVASNGLGEQGVAFGSPADAMQYNPANLASASGAELSFYRNPWNLLGWSVPLISFSASAALPNGAGVGLEYTFWDLGEFSYATPDGPSSGTFHYYERSVAVGYGMPVADELAVGAQLRYIWQPLNSTNNVNHLLISAGLSYQPALLEKRVTVGFSLMNFGTKIEYDLKPMNGIGSAESIIPSDPPPAQIHLGIKGLPVTNRYFDLSLALGATKPVVKRTGPPDHAAQSSFTSLFNDWHDAPRDMTAQLGLGYLWHPLDLGSDIAFVQEFYFGYFTTGPAELYNSFYTHGLKIGLETLGIRAMVGYAGRWHNNNAGSYIPWEFPWETFQFTLSSDLSLLGMNNRTPAAGSPLKKIVVSTGYTRGLVVGKMRKNGTPGFSSSFDNNNFWSVETDFYVDERSALVTSLQYARMNLSATVAQPPFTSSPFTLGIGMETFGLEAGFRYHPVEEFQPLFVQGSLGIIRMNPVPNNTQPRYFYQTFDRLLVGGMVSLWDSGVELIPHAGLQTIFLGEGTDGSRLGGYNQWEFGINVGYEL